MQDTFLVTDIGAVFTAQFLVSAEAVVGEEVLIFETSIPAPEDVAWSVNGPGAATQVRVERNSYAYVFDTPGTYAITLDAGIGTCTSTVTKEIRVYVSADSIGLAQPAFSELLEFAAAPNPTVGPLDVTVEYSSVRNLSLRIYDVASALVDSRELRGAARYEESFDLGARAPGVYYVVPTGGTESHYRTVVRQ